LRSFTLKILSSLHSKLYVNLKSNNSLNIYHQKHYKLHYENVRCNLMQKGNKLLLVKYLSGFCFNLPNQNRYGQFKNNILSVIFLIYDSLCFVCNLESCHIYKSLNR